MLTIDKRKDTNFSTVYLYRHDLFITKYKDKNVVS